MPPSVKSENLTEEQSEQTPGLAWPSAGFSCSERPTAFEAAICCKDAVESTSLGQARILAEGPTLTGNCLALGEGDTLTGSPSHSHSSIWVLCYCICLSASHLYNQKGAQSPAATLCKALTYRRQK